MQPHSPTEEETPITKLPECRDHLQPNPPRIINLRLMLVWGCWPVWMYDPIDGFIDQDLPHDLPSYSDLVAAFTDIQTKYNALYLNTPREFSWIGFRSQEEEDQFKENWYATVARLKEAAGEKYIVIDEVDFSTEDAED